MASKRGVTFPVHFLPKGAHPVKRLFFLLLVSAFCVGTAHAGCQSTNRSIDITTCGAICDGADHFPILCPGSNTQTTVDLCAINKALDIVGQGGGGEVIIPPGTCVINPTRGRSVTDGTANWLHLYR